MNDLSKLKEIDPIKRMVEKESKHPEFSPMDPPDAYNPPGIQSMNYDDMHPFLQGLIEEHCAITKALNDLESTLVHLQADGLSRQANDNLSKFFKYFDNQLKEHCRKEEQVLFPLLKQRQIEIGEHSKGRETITGVHILENDHIQSRQMAAVVFNFLALSGRLPDAASRILVLDSAIEEGKSLVELLKLHIFRENNVIFAQSQRLLTTEELDTMLLKSSAIK